MTSAGIWSIESSTESRLPAGSTSEVVPVGGDELWFTVPSSEGAQAIVPVPADAREQTDGRVIFTSGSGDLQIVASRVSAAPDTSTVGRLVSDSPPTVARAYKGKQQADANGLFVIEARGLAARGYVPTTQSWAAGRWGNGAWLTALVLCLVVVGFLALVYMLIVTPEGTLTVTYEHRGPVPLVAPEAVAPEAVVVAPTSPSTELLPTDATPTDATPAGATLAEPMPAEAMPAADDTMPCPRCAETIKQAATACRFCGLDLAATDDPEAAAPIADDMAVPIA